MILTIIKASFWLFVMLECVTLFWPSLANYTSRKWMDRVYWLWSLAVMVTLSPLWATALLALPTLNALVILLDQAKIHGGILAAAEKTRDPAYYAAIRPRYFWVSRLDAGLSLLLLAYLYFYIM